MQDSRFSKIQTFFEKYFFYFLLALYFLASFLLFDHYKLQINPDGISYLSIAKEYLAGNFNEAINAYWGPLLSWIFVPFLKLGFPDLVAARLAAVFIGALTLLSVWLLSFAFRMGPKLRMAMMLITLPSIIYFVFYLITPDLLMVAVLSFYLAAVLNKKYRTEISYAILTGFLGVLLYLTKSYGFYFFLAQFLVLNIIYSARVKKENRLKIVRQFLVAIFVFVVLSGVWTLLLKNKYGHFVVSTTGSYNFEYGGPEVPNHPMHTEGLLSPPNQDAVSAWEDPSYLQMKSWSIFSSRASLRYELQIIRNNLIKTYDFWNGFAPLAIVTFLFFFVLSLGSFKEMLYKNRYLLVTLTIIIYILGYILILIEGRYLWPLTTLLILMTGALLNHLFLDRTSFNFERKIVFLLAVFLLFALGPINQLNKIKNGGQETSSMHNALQAAGADFRGRVASNDSWAGSLYLAYYEGAQYFGTPKPKESDEEIYQELKNKDIEYYLVWDEKNPPPFFANSQEVSRGAVEGLKIYKVKN